MPQFTMLSSVVVAIAKLFYIMNKPSKLDPLDLSRKKPSTYKGNITIYNINFAYPLRPLAQVL